MKAQIEPTHIRCTIELFSSDGSSRAYPGDIIALPPACDQDELKLSSYWATGNTWAKLPEPVKMNRVNP